MAEFKTIPLKEIKTDPNQPRKFNDALAMEELTNSVREKGILQPILVRPNGNGYILVCGERRYKAALSVNTAFKDRNTIPAVIRELSDEEALELQIIENLQRKDVHPMEEAVAFKSLLERKTHALTVEEISARIGKGIHFVKQRLKLNALTKDWQEAFFGNLVQVKDAIKIAALHESQQIELGKEQQLKDSLKRNARIEISNWSLNKYLGNLSTATFDLNDPTLSKSGPCTTCQFNSAVSSLFPEDVKNPVCTNIPNFVLKTNEAFKRNLKAAMDDPGTILIATDYYISEDEKKPFQKNGAVVYGQNQYTSVNQPDKPEWIEFCEDNDELSEEQQQKEFGEEMKDYEKQMKEFDDKIAGGKYLKGFVVISNQKKGKTLYVKLDSNKSSSGSSKATAEKAKEGKLTALDIDEEIKRINEREKRNKELDIEKVQKNIVLAVDKHKAFSQPGLKMQKIDRSILVHLLLFETAGYSIRTKLKTALKVKEASYGAKAYQFDHFKQLEKITEEQLAFLIRSIVKEKYAGESQTSPTAGATAVRLMAEYLGDIDIKTFEKDQAEVAARRLERVAGRLNSLKKQKEELKQTKPSAEKPVPKKAVKKK